MLLRPFAAGRLRYPGRRLGNAYVLPTHAWRFVDVWPRTATMLRDVGETLNAWRATVTPMPSAARRVRRLGAWASARGGVPAGNRGLRPYDSAAGSDCHSPRCNACVWDR